MGSQVTNRVSIVHERPLPYKALRQRLLGAGERGFKGALLGRNFSARAGFSSQRSRGWQGGQSPLSGAGMGPQDADRAAGPGRALRRGAGPGLRAPRSPDGRLQRQSRRKFLPR